jgi:hypothetical protein
MITETSSCYVVADASTDSGGESELGAVFILHHLGSSAVGFTACLRRTLSAL